MKPPLPPCPAGMPTEAHRTMWEDLDRRLDEDVDFIKRYPRWRFTYVLEVLGAAVALCDSFGVDAQAFLTKLRATEPMPPVLFPPRREPS